MADFTTLADSLFTTGKPILGSSQIAQRDNYIAIAEGATGAPRILLPALERLSAGTTIRSRNDTAIPPSASDEGTFVGHSLGFIQSGEVRVSFTITDASGGPRTTTVIRTRAGVETTLLTQKANGTYTVDAAVLPGDIIRIQMVGTQDTAGRLSNCRFQTNGENIWPASAARLENTYA